MPGQPPAIRANCEKCGAPINLATQDGITPFEKTNDLESRLSALEKKIDSLPKLNETKELVIKDQETKNKPSDLVEQIIAFRPTYYITFISIIQSAALGYLLLTIKNQFTETFTRGSYDLIWIVLIAAMFLVIVAVWQEYLIGCSAFQWVPTLPDVILPFLIGLTEFMAILTIDLQRVAWAYFAGGLVCVVGFINYYNTYHQAGLLYERNKAALRLLGNSPRINLIGALLFAMILFVFSWYETISNSNTLYLAMILLVMVIAWIIRGQLNWAKIIQR